MRGGLAVGLLAAALAGPAGGTRQDRPVAGDTVFADDFESGVLRQWNDRGRPATHAITTDPARVHGGARALELTFPAGADAGWLVRFFMPGYDSLYASYWIYLETGWRGGTKLISFYGARVDNQWSAAGKAGVCPTGSDFFNLSLVTEPRGDPGPMRFYTYYPGMPRLPNGVCWGSPGLGAGMARYEPPLTLAPGAWHHVELWARLNQPGQADGEQTFWLDGVRRGTWSGLTLRTTRDLRLNAFVITNSIPGGAPRAQRAWIDDVTVLSARPAGR